MYYNIVHVTFENSDTHYPVNWDRIDVKPSDEAVVREHDVCLQIDESSYE